MTGKFIVFEGADGVGKTTQIGLLKRDLERRGYAVTMTREPGGSSLAVRDMLLSVENEISPVSEALLFAADRAQHMAEVVLPALERDEIVICDRFILSSLAYQGIVRGLGVEDVWKINELAIGSVKPDMTFVLTCDRSLIDSRMNRPLDRLESTTNWSDVNTAIIECAYWLQVNSGFKYHVVDTSADPTTVLYRYLWHLDGVI